MHEQRNQQSTRRKPTGIRKRHSRFCPSLRGGRCTAGRANGCEPSWEAWVWDNTAKKKIRKHFRIEAEAKLWRSDSYGAVERGALRQPTKTTLREAAEEWLEGAKSGAIKTRSGDPWKPSTLHGYEQALKLRVLPVLGNQRLSRITAMTLQGFVERLNEEGLDASTVRNALMPLRAIYRRACRPGGEILVNPTRGLELPSVRGRRDRIVPPEEAARLLGELDLDDRAVWATAVYAGLRRGELLALTAEDVDLDDGVIRVGRSYDPRSGETTVPKSRAGVRAVPIAAVLRDYLAGHLERTGRSGGDLVFGRTAATPFSYTSLVKRTARAWRDAEVERARRSGATDDESEAVAREFRPPLTLHEGRHTFASLMIAAGVNAKTLSTFMGHSSVSITLDRYGHLFPGSENETAVLLDAFLARADTKARLAQIEAD